MEQPQQDGKHDAPAEPEKGDRESNRDVPPAKLSPWDLLLTLALVLLGTAGLVAEFAELRSTDDAQIEGARIRVLLCARERAGIFMDCFRGIAWLTLPVVPPLFLILRFTPSGRPQASH